MTGLLYWQVFSIFKSQGLHLSITEIRGVALSLRVLQSLAIYLLDATGTLPPTEPQMSPDTATWSSRDKTTLGWSRCFKYFPEFIGRGLTISMPLSPQSEKQTF